MNLSAALKPSAGHYSPAFLRAIAFVLEHETEFEKGHYDDYSHVRTERDPSDPGGTTRYGIDQRSHPHVDVAHLDLAGALAIYHVDEWTAIHGDELPVDVALVTFDAAVNVGTEKAAQWLQAALGVVADGQIGPKTLAAAKTAKAGIVDHMLDSRDAYYHALGQRSQFRRFLAGWLNRTDDLRNTIGVA